MKILRKRRLPASNGVVDGRLMLNATAAMLAVTGMVGGLLALARNDTTDLRGEPNSTWLAGGQKGLALLGAVGGVRPSYGVQVEKGAASDYDVVTIGDQVVVSDRPNGRIIVLDGRDGKELNSFPAPVPTDDRAVVVAAGDAAYVVDVTEQAAMRIGPDGSRGDQIPIDGGFSDWVGSGDGRLWFLDVEDGETAIFDGERVARAGLADRGAALTISMVGQDPVVLDRTAGKLRWPRRSESIDLGSTEAVLQQPGRAADCTTVLIANEVRCLTAEGVTRSMPFVTDSPLTAQLFVTDTTVAAVWPGSEQVVTGSWRSGKVAPARRLEPSKRSLVGHEVVGQLLLDDPASGYAITVNENAVTDMEKFSKQTIIITADGQTAGGVTEVNGPSNAEAELGDGDATDSKKDDDGVNDPPRARDDEVNVRPGGNVDINVRKNDFDPDGDQVTITAAGPVSGPGSANIVSGRSIVYSAPLDASGSASFPYTISDPAGLTDDATVRVRIITDGENTAPQLQDDAFTTQADTPVEVDPLANDSDNEGDTLTISRVSDPTHGTAQRADDTRQVIYTPKPGFVGIDSFQYFVSDGHDGIAQATIQIEVTRSDGSNRPPIAHDDINAVVAGSNRILSVLDNDEDPDGDRMTVQPLDGAPDGLTLTLLSGGRIDVRAAKGASGLKSFEYTIEDPGGLKSSATVTLTIERPVGNRPPVARDDIDTTTPGVAKNVLVKGNDFDPDNDPVTIVDVQQPATGGSVSQLPGDPNSLRFVPDETARAGTSVTFRYTIQDTGGRQASARVRVDIVDVSGAGPIANPDNYEFFPGDVIIMRVVDNDTHPDDLPFSIVGQPSSQYPASSFIVSDKTIEFIPPSAGSGTYTFRYTIADSSSRTSSATVTVTISERPVENQAPVPVEDIRQTERGVPVVVDVLANDSDPENDPLRIVNASDPSHGRAQISDGKIRYVPDGDYTGLDNFTYTVTDDKHPPVEQTVVISVLPPANSPPIAEDDLMQLIVDESQSIDPTGNDLDLDGTVLKVQTFREDPALTVTRAPGSNVLKVRGSTVGRFEITYVIVDADGSSANGTIVVVVAAPPNEPPVARNDVGEQILPNQSLVVDVLANDFDPDGGKIEIAEFSQPTSSDGGNPGTVEQVGGGLRYKPNKKFAGVAKFTYVIRDGEGARSGQATVSVTVNPCPPPPVLSALSESTRYQKSVKTYVLGRGDRPEGVLTVTQPDGQPGTVTILDEARGQVKYSPPDGFNGTITYGFTLTTPCDDIVTSTVEVIVNQPPNADDDQTTTTGRQPVTIDVLANDSAGENGDVLTIQSTTSATGGTARIVGSQIEFTPSANSTGTGSFTYTVADEGGQTAQANVTINIDNTPPQANDDLTFDKIQPGDTKSFAVLDNDIDPDGDQLDVTDATVVLGSGNAAIVGNQVEFTAASNAGGPIEITYTISDGRDTSSAVLKLRVNRAPVAGDVSDSDRLPGPLVIAALQGSSDPDGDPISIDGTPTIISGPAGSSIVGVNGFGQITVDTANQSGTVVIAFTVTDGALTANGTATLTVKENNPPQANDVFIDVTGTDGVTIDLNGHVSDPDGDSLTISITGVSADGDYTNNGGGSITVRSVSGTPGSSFTVSYQVDDGQGGTASATIHVTVN